MCGDGKVSTSLHAATANALPFRESQNSISNLTLSSHFSWVDSRCTKGSYKSSWITPFLTQNSIFLDGKVYTLLHAATANALPFRESQNSISNLTLSFHFSWVDSRCTKGFHKSSLIILVTDWTFGLAELFGQTSTVWFSPNDSTFSCKTQKFLLYYLVFIASFKWLP